MKKVHIFLIVLLAVSITPLCAQFCDNIITVTNPISATGYIYQANTAVIGQNNIQSGATASYRAGTFIDLQVGFHAISTSGFDATITNVVCDNVVNEVKDAFLVNPAPCAARKMPVVVISYLPVTSGNMLDATHTGFSATIASMQSKIMEASIQTKFMLEEGSKFHGYKDPTASPYLGYEIVDYIYVYEPLPQGFAVPWNPSAHRPDYIQILNRINGQHYVENLGVKEFWLWGYHYGPIEPAESNMSSPVTGDISNSERTNDLPVYSKSFILYNYNYGRSAAEAVHDHGHQQEAQLAHVNQVQDGNQVLFRDKFVGWGNGPGGAPLGRCGDTHHPVNTSVDYDYMNMTPVTSDIEDWQPSGGPTSSISAATWAAIPYAWPYSNPPSQQTESHWYIYWMQNYPGANNSIPYNTNFMTNWWEYTADWDQNNITPLGLYSSTPTPVVGCAPSPLRNDLTEPNQTLEESNLVTIYPNPASNEITIALNAFGDKALASVKLLDITGKVVFTKENVSTTLRIDVSEMGRGIYNVMVTSGKKMTLQNVVLR